MSLSTAFNVISSSFAANAAQTAAVSNNIANVNTPGYSREIANVVTNAYGGSDVASITREANAALLEQVSTSTSQGGKGRPAVPSSDELHCARFKKNHGQ